MIGAALVAPLALSFTAPGVFVPTAPAVARAPAAQLMFGGGGGGGGDGEGGGFMCARTHIIEES